MTSKRWLALIAFSAATFLSLAAATCGSTTTRVENSGSQQPTGISVNGTGHVSVAPDLAQVTLGVSTLRDTVQQARDDAATALDAMIKSLKANGVADKDIQTQQLSITPEYDYSPASNEQRLRGFRVSNVVTAKLRDINKTSKVVDDAVAAGGNETQIQGITFTVDKPDDVKDQARSAAVADAKAKAETLANAAGVKVGAPTMISEESYTPPVYDTRAAAGVAAPDVAPSTPVQPGELDVTVTVSVTFAIE